MSASLEFDPLSQEDIAWRDDPYSLYRELRDHAPVHYSEKDGVFVVSRYDDVMQVLRSNDVFSSRAMFTMLMNGGNERPPIGLPLLKLMVRMVWTSRMNPTGFATSRHLIAEDGDSHTELRGVVNRGFTPRRISSWQPRIEALARECVAKLDSGRAFDVVEDLAVPLPVTVISELLGIDPEMREEFKHCSDVVIATTAGPKRSEPLNKDMRDALIFLSGYLPRVAQKRRKDPADDIISAIVAEQDGDLGLSDREVLQFVILLLVAGNETTTNLIGNSVRALLTNPSELASVTGDLSLVPGLVEESVRFDSPVQLVCRNAIADTEIAGVAIPKGAVVIPLIGSANRDERQFDDPDRFDIRRNPQAHVGFGFGKHFCLGASLARLEAASALTALVPALPKLVCENESPPLVDSFLVRGRQELLLHPMA